MTNLTINDVPLFLLVLARVAGMVAVAPVFGSQVVPMGLKAAIALALSVVFFPIVPHAVPAPHGLEIAMAMAGEVAVGLAMGFTASLLFAAVQSGGAILDQELGFSLATALDPSSGEPVALIAQFKLMLASAVYLLVDGHHLLLSALADSYRAVPLRGAALPGTAGEIVATLGSGLFATAIKVAAPALVAVFAVTLATAFVARVMPESGVFVSGLPVRTLVGLLVLAAGLGGFVTLFAASVREGNDVTRAALQWIGGKS
jgi:flagellar biosynthetic protein FliR